MAVGHHRTLEKTREAGRVTSEDFTHLGERVNLYGREMEVTRIPIASRSAMLTDARFSRVEVDVVVQAGSR
jgi:hypothetical protein